MEKSPPGHAFPIVAIIGRPNVGKSTLFNRLIGKRHAITSQVAGTTRDRIYQTFDLGPYHILLVDTGGLSFDTHEDLECDVHSQTLAAISEADLILFVVDGSTELLATDFDAASLLRKSHKPVILLAQKADRPQVEEQLSQLYELGIGDPLAVSALHGIGFDELKSSIEEKLKTLFSAPPVAAPRDESIKVCFLGKPNVGKSSLVNKLCGQERIIVSEKPGTTVDSTDTLLTLNDVSYTLIDTAGIRRAGKVEMGIEKWSVIRSLEAILRCDVAYLVLDAGEGITHQDLKVSSYVLEAGKGLVIVMNKSDLPQVQESREFLMREAKKRMAYMPWAPLIFVSAKTGQYIEQMLQLAQDICKERRRTIADEQLTQMMEELIANHPPRGIGKPKLLGVTQSALNPPTFVFSTNSPQSFHFSYRRYMENMIRERFGFQGTPIKIILQLPRKVRRS